MNKARLPDIGFESYDSMEGLIAIDPGGTPRRFDSWPRAKLIHAVYPGVLVAGTIALRTSSGRITDILNGKRGISPETAMRLARYFGNSARFWLNLQVAYELATAEAELGERIASEVTPAAA